MTITINEKGAAQLMQLLTKRGYFHQQATGTKIGELEDANIISTSFSTFMTMDVFRSKARAELNECGRLTFSELAARLGVKPSQVERMFLNRSDELYDRYGKDTIITKHKQQEMVSALVSEIHNGDGRVNLSSVAKSFQLSSEDTLAILRHHLPADIHMKALDNGSKVLVTDRYWERTTEQLEHILKEISSPTSIETLVRQSQMERTWLLALIREYQDIGHLQGDSFTPFIYQQHQRKQCICFFSDNGYITTKQAHAFRLLPSQLKEYICEKFPDALVFDDSVVNLDVIVPPIEAAVSESIEGNGWVDLQPYCPDILMNYPCDLRAFLIDHVTKDQGIVNISAHCVLFLSNKLIEAIERDIMPSLIKSVVTEQVQSLTQKGQGQISQSTNASSRLLRSEKIAEAVVEKYPNVSSVRSILGGQTALQEICNEYFLTEARFRECDEAIEAELAKLSLTPRSFVLDEYGSDITTFEAQFERQECFVNLCYIIQTKAKFLQYASQCGMASASIKQLRDDYLHGCCADFTRRLTEFCFVKNHVKRSQFNLDQRSVFDPTYFYSPADIVAHHFPDTFLSCEPDEKGKQQNPLIVLEEVLPPPIGTLLKQQWILCGPNCYDSRWSEANSQRDFQFGDVDAFLGHISENCIVICGVPFKKLGKKSEKQFLAVRRQCLVQRLEQTSDAAEVLELTIMLLYQSIKNLVVSGSMLRELILRQLVKERKIPDLVATELLAYASSIEAGEVNARTLNRVRQLGLCRDITKHNIVTD